MQGCGNTIFVKFLARKQISKQVSQFFWKTKQKTEQKVDTILSYYIVLSW